MFLERGLCSAEEELRCESEEHRVQSDVFKWQKGQGGSNRDSHGKLMDVRGVQSRGEGLRMSVKEKMLNSKVSEGGQGDLGSGERW